MGNFFGAPSMLWWAAAASVPIAIHLLSRRRFRKVPWAAMELINRAFKKTRKRLRLENLLLLLLRILALVLFAMALADPRLDGGKLFGGGEGSRNVIILMDGSFSMGARDSSDRAAFERAKRLATELLGDLNSDRDAASLIMAASPAQLSLPLTRELSRVRDSLESSEITDASTDTLGGLRIAAGLLAEPELESEFPGSRTVYIFTDMQKRPFVAAADALTPEDVKDAPDAAFEKALRDLEGLGAKVVFVDVGIDDDNARRNVAISNLTHVGKTLVTGVETEFEIRVANFGPIAAGGEVQFFVDQEETFVRSERVEELGPRSANAGTEIALRFSATFDEPGWHYVAARYVDDALSIDNLRRYAFFVRERIRVLSVHGNAPREPDEAASFYVTRALDPFAGTRRSETSFSVKEISSVAMSAEKFRDYDFVVLSDVSQMSPQKITELELFVSEGGALLYFAGPSLEAPGRIGFDGGSTNELFFKDGQGLFPGRLTSAIGADEFTDTPYALQFETFDHPATAYFEDKKIRPGITRIPVFKFAASVVEPDDDKVRVLASFREAGEDAAAGKAWPALLERRFGEGRSFMITTSADRRWNLLGASPAYVPLVREIAYYLTQENRRANRLVGQPLRTRFEPTVTKVSIEQGKRPAEQRSPTLSPDTTTAELLIPRLPRAELIRMRYDDPQGDAAQSRVFAVNVDSDESDLERASSGWLKLHFGDDLLTVVRNFDEIIEEGDSAEQSRLWRFFLYLVLGALILETILAQRFSRKQSSGEVAA